MYLFIFIYSFICSSIDLFAHLFIYLSIYLSIDLFLYIAMTVTHELLKTQSLAWFISVQGWGNKLFCAHGAKHVPCIMYSTKMIDFDVPFR